VAVIGGVYSYFLKKFADEVYAYWKTGHARRGNRRGNQGHEWSKSSVFENAATMPVQHAGALTMALLRLVQWTARRISKKCRDRQPGAVRCARAPHSRC
jgi:hypothetical protein